MTVSSIILLLALIILLGFTARLTFRWTKIPVPVILMLTGMVFGPILHLLPRELLMPVAPVFGTIALLLILFEGGLELDIESVVRQMRPAVVLGLFTFALSMGVATVMLGMALGISWPASILFGCIVGGSSPAVVFPTVHAMAISRDAKTALALEAAVSEVLTVVSVVIAMNVILSGSATTLAMAPPHLVWGIGIALLIGTGIGMLWVPVLSRYGKESMAYIVTLAVVFLTYVITETFGAHGVIAVLALGMVLANVHWLHTRIIPFIERWTTVDVSLVPADLDNAVMRMNTEMSFLVRTFFFVYTGMIIDVSTFDLPTTAVTLGIVVLMLAIRVVGIRLVQRRAPAIADARISAIAMVPRGLATIVMALTALASGIPGMETVTQIVFGVVLLSNLAMAATLMADRRGDVPAS
jgi:potassium/hydrogen antiporter